ncbi:MAG TPA: 4-oxalocrotonate tautomerase family protein [Malonomonas sp.]
MREDRHMPYVQVKITKGATNEQKAQLIEGITDLLVSVLDKNPASTQIMITEVEPENWGIAGRSVKRLRAEGKTANISKK